MNDMELADLLKEMTMAVKYFDPDAVTKVGILWPRIIAALRRGHEPSTRMAVEDAIDKSKMTGTWEKLSRPPSGEMVMVLTELVRLYDWRRDVGAAITDEQARQYGREKKAAWEAAKRVLSAAEAEGRKS